MTVKLAAAAAAMTLMVGCGADISDSSDSSLKDAEYFVNLKTNSTKEDRGGDICVAVFNKKEGFPNDADATIFADCFAMNDVISGIKIPLPSAGKYSFSVFHDQNQDGDLNTTGPFKIPKEGFGFSNDPKIGTSAPSFEATAIDVVGGEDLDIKLRYIL